MKVLIISDEEEFVSKIDSFFKNNKCDTIKYKWLLKALDNIEEIQPDLIVISSAEYPRHWKTLVQFVKSGIGGDSVSVYLYQNCPLSEDDNKKAKALGINGFFTNLDESTLSNQFNSYIEISNNNDVTTPVINIEEKEDDFDEEELPTVSAIVEAKKSGHVIVSNPNNNSFVCGKVVSFNNGRLEVILDFNLEKVSNNDLINYVTYFNEDECYSFSAEIFILNETNNSVILTIKEHYGEI